MTAIDRLIVEGLGQGPFALENQKAVSKLYEYKQIYLPEAKKEWPIEESKKRSYEIWAIDELIYRTMFNSETPFFEILDDFQAELNEARNREGSCTDIFEAAEDLLEEVKYWMTWEY